KPAPKKSWNTKSVSTDPSKRFQSSSPTRRSGRARPASGSFKLWKFCATRKKSGRERNTASCRCSVAWLLCVERQRNKEATSCSGTTFDPDPPAVGLDDFLTNRQSESGADAVRGQTGRGWGIFVEDRCDFVFGNAYAAILHPQNHIGVVIAPRRYLDFTTDVGELERVAQEIV